ncbi:MAG: hypothetical protein J5586_03985, partial [Clostridia bacterium]|nr:hypothetical protein [Clostridia bacterium]
PGAFVELVSRFGLPTSSLPTHPEGFFLDVIYRVILQFYQCFTGFFKTSCRSLTQLAAACFRLFFRARLGFGLGFGLEVKNAKSY